MEADRDLPIDQFLDENRVRLRDWLGEQQESLKELYEGSIDLLYLRKPPGCVRLVSHAVREIGNSLPNALSSVEKRERLENAEKVENLSQTWAKYVDVSSHSRLPAQTATTTGALSPFSLIVID
jgi:hypothetical protein